MRILFALILLLCVSLPAFGQTVVIKDNLGGNIWRFQQERKALAQVDEVRIAGGCYSACAIFTTLPNACVGAKALIGFHGSDVPLPFFRKPFDDQMGKYFRGEVKRRFDERWRHLRGPDEIHVITGAQLVRLDPEIRLCSAKE